MPKHVHLSKVSRIYVSESILNFYRNEIQTKIWSKNLTRSSQKLISGIQVLQLEPGTVDLKQAGGVSFVCPRNLVESSLPNPRAHR